MSSKRRLRRKAERVCHRKVKYDTQGEADDQLSYLCTGDGVADATTLHSYRCSNCHGWHLGNRRPATPTRFELHGRRNV